MECSEGECESPALSRGLCNKHYKAWRRRGSPVEPALSERAPAVCALAGCELRATVRGHCGKHYKMRVRNGELDTAGEVITCSVESCDRRTSARGLCHGHYIRWSRNGDVCPERPLTRPDKEQCSVAGCEKWVHSRG